ncbi:hypothetical protein NQ318_019597 [Aromia moschata]|uniref:Homeobox domain-containing protein n=1 Tax=Aromia moschata TaxID=1265417 RepID=A0AAV8Z6P2_9CUCU|nr:hypothetical protein NQ318_019597 [Aromia moschata]
MPHVDYTGGNACGGDASASRVRERRAYGEDKRPPKRLFTPEIKRFLKDWLVRRRENPYPNREEKENACRADRPHVCNWFANWRRKLKNAGKEPQQKTWGDLIKTYNNQVQGNVEHFSICSDDSIWEEPEDESYSGRVVDHSYTYANRLNNNDGDVQDQCYFVSSTTENDAEGNPFSQPSSKYKSHIMEKYLRDCQKPDEVGDEGKPSMISKWLESAANFKPSENSYLDWTLSRSSKKSRRVAEPTNGSLLAHGREELDAAEALTTLANSRYAKCNPGLL